MRCKKIILKKAYEGLPKISDFELVEEDVSDGLKDGEYLYESLYVSVDPYIRAYQRLGVYKEGDTILGIALVRVTKSKHPKFPEGELLLLRVGWRNGGKADDEVAVFSVRSDLPKSVPLGSAVGLYGIPGLTAYIGLIDICKIKKGETVFINGAAGAVGNVAGQIAKLKGCRVVGSCGSDEKVDFAKSIGYDEVFNYKTVPSLAQAIERVAPNGIDCYFDNVGGEFSSTLLPYMNKYGRIAVCGAISMYNATKPDKIEDVQLFVITRELSMKGFLVNSYMDRFQGFYDQLKAWTEEGKLKCCQTVTDGFENLPKAFIGMLTGENIGKAVVKL